MRTSTRRTSRRSVLASMRMVAALVLTAGALTVTGQLTSVHAATGTFPCSAAFKIDHTLVNGARWQMCWEERAIEGIVLHDITFTPPHGATPILVLAQANLATLHVPYDDNGARFYDETDYGLGGSNLQDLATADCPNGTRLVNGAKHDLCMATSSRGYAYKSYTAVAQGTQLDVHSVSAIGQYNYVEMWHFGDDGSIRPEMGASGQLQRFGGTTATGWPVGGGRTAIAHFHNYYWRLDFDLNGAANDAVEQIAAAPNAARDQLTDTHTKLTVETATKVDPATSRTWRVLDTVAKNTDGHAISYEIFPSNANLFHGPVYEPFTNNELYVTVNKPCEKWVAHNATTGGCAGNVSAFVNGQSLVGADVVLWYGTSFHHLPRDEDESHMDTHWTSFLIQPRDLTATNPIP
jgi:primary-amine oxidase